MNPDRRSFLFNALALPAAIAASRVVDFDIIDVSTGARIPPSDSDEPTPGERIQQAEAVYHRTHRYAFAVEESRWPLVERLGDGRYKGVTGDAEQPGTLLVHAYRDYPQWTWFDADSASSHYTSAVRDDALTRDAWQWSKMHRDAWYAVTRARRVLLLAAQRIDAGSATVGYAAMTINGRDYLFGAARDRVSYDSGVYWGILVEGAVPCWSF